MEDRRSRWKPGREDVGPQLGVDPVGADHHVSFGDAAVGERHAGGFGGLPEADRVAAGADDAGGQVRGKKPDVVGAVHAEAGIPPRGVGDLHWRDRRAVVAEIGGFRADAGAPALHRAAEPDALKVTHGVRRNVDAGADLADRRSLLIDGDAQPARE